MQCRRITTQDAITPFRRRISVRTDRQNHKMPSTQKGDVKRKTKKKKKKGHESKPTQLLPWGRQWKNM
jgi:hypothetical protein